MRLENLLSGLDSDKYSELLFVCGARPFYRDNFGDLVSTKEAFINDEDLREIIKDYGVDWAITAGDGCYRKYFFKNEKKYFAKILLSKNLFRMEVSLARDNFLDLEELDLPGYVYDWSQSKEGVLVFFGSEKEEVKKIQKSFSKYRANKLSGTSLVFGDLNSDFTFGDDHQVSFGYDQDSYLAAASTDDLNFFDFTSYSNQLKPGQLQSAIRDVDRGSLVTLPVYWNDLGMIWSEIDKLFTRETSEDLFFIEKVIGFFGVKTVRSKSGEKEYFFEVIPFSSVNRKDYKKANLDKKKDLMEMARRDEGYSFNQSLQSLVLKRKVILDKAYSVSPNPKELNSMLTKAGF